MTGIAGDDRPDTDMALARLAAKIRAPRGVFEASFDELAGPDAASGLMFKALARLRAKHGPAVAENGDGDPSRLRDEADYLAALKHARERGWLSLFLVRFSGRLFGPAGGQLQRSISGELQAIVNLNQKFQLAVQLQNGLISALRRCCKIRIAMPGEDPAQGSGFLIGPHLVLTNWHVVRHALDDANRPRPQSRDAMTLSFDVLQDTDGRLLDVEKVKPIAEDWLVAFSPATDNEIGAADQAGFWPDDDQQLRDNLDFAVIELDRPVGHRRGWYDLGESVWPNDPAAAVELLQFPREMSMHGTPGSLRSDIRTERFGAGVPPRFLHSANSLGGSSGGLILGYDKTPIGLHQAGLQFRETDPRDEGSQQANAGIPLKLIEDRAGQAIRDRVARVPDPLYCSAEGTPIIGRSRLRSLIEGARRNSYGILVIEPPFGRRGDSESTRIGKSYTQDILEAMLPPERHHVLYLSAEIIRPNAFETARAILSVESSRVAGFLSDSLNTTMDADAVGQLVDGFVQALRDAAQGRTVWLVIDDIDRYQISSNSSASTFLHALYRRTRTETNLKIVLIGVPLSLAVFAELNNVEGERLEGHLSDREIAEWLDLLGQEAGPFPAGFSDKLLKLVLSIAAAASENPAVGRTAAIAEVLAAHIMKAFSAKGSNHG